MTVLMFDILYAIVISLLFVTTTVSTVIISFYHTPYLIQIYSRLVRIPRFSANFSLLRGSRTDFVLRLWNLTLYLQLVALSVKFVSS